MSAWLADEQDTPNAKLSPELGQHLQRIPLGRYHVFFLKTLVFAAELSFPLRSGHLAQRQHAHGPSATDVVDRLTLSLTHLAAQDPIHNAAPSPHLRHAYKVSLQVRIDHD